MRLSNGRWRASGPDKLTFTEPAEDLAVLLYRQWQARTYGDWLLRIPVVLVGTSIKGATNSEVNAVLAPRAEAVIGDDEKATVTRAAFPDAI